MNAQYNALCVRTERALLRRGVDKRRSRGVPHAALITTMECKSYLLRCHIKTINFSPYNNLRV